MKKILTIILIAVAKLTYACSCSEPTLLQNINRADFIATAKILKITQNKSNEEYHDIEVELIDLYKGERTTKLKIWSTQNSSCNFFTPVGTTWLIYASYDQEKVLTFHYCGGSAQIDRMFDLKTYPGVNKRYAATINLKLQVLYFFKNQKIMPRSKILKDFPMFLRSLNNLRGYNGTQKDFCVVKLRFDRNNRIKTHAVKKFNNGQLTKELLDCIDKDFNNDKLNLKDKLGTQYLIFYFYPMEGADKSFVSTFDV